MVRISAIAALLVGVFTAIAPAEAGIVSTELRAVEAAPAPNAALPLGLGFLDDSDHAMTLRDAMARVPTVLIFADYTCRTLCGPVLEIASAGLKKSGLRPGVDYRLVVIGLDPRDKPAAAQASRAEHIGDASALDAATVFLTGDAAAVQAVTQAAGLRYAYDAEHDQYAHPAAVYLIDATGRVQRVLSPLGLDGAGLRLAIVDVGRGAAGTLADRIHLLCYGYDPASGVYTERITAMLAFAVGLTLAVLLGIIGHMAVKERRHARS